MMDEDLNEFFTDIEATIKTTESKSLSDFKAKVLRKFLAAVALKLISKTHKATFEDVVNISGNGDALPSNPDKLNFDPSPINTTTFVVTQASLETPVKAYKAHGKAALFIALGDSMAIPHFYSGSGVSTGREGVEIAASRIRSYNHGFDDYYHFDHLAKIINDKMKYIKAEVQQRGSAFGEQRDETSIKELAIQKMEKTIEGYCKKTKHKKTLDHHYDFKIFCHLKNGFHIRTKKGVFYGYVDNEGELIVDEKLLGQ
uniref:Uncharacterized protein n=1 Tax=Ditylenchus dipsaci TaxID=166011 RepID=A0A915EBD6_9BILA